MVFLVLFFCFFILGCNSQEGNRRSEPMGAEKTVAQKAELESKIESEQTPERSSVTFFCKC